MFIEPEISSIVSSPSFPLFFLLGSKMTKFFGEDD